MEEPSLETGRVQIDLSNAEAVVLYDFLAREARRDLDAYAIEHQAEQRVLWDIEAMLESSLIEVVNPKYATLVEIARAEVQDEVAET